MNTLRLAALSLLIMMVTPIGVHAHCGGKHTGSHPHCSRGAGDDENLKRTFDLTIEPTVPVYISEDIGVYKHDSKKKVYVSGSGTGFRFDTNLQNDNKLSRWLKARFVYMTVTGDGIDTAPYEIDLRFNLANGLDLGSLAEGTSGTVAASLFYYGGNQVVGFNAPNHGVLGFGNLNPPVNTTDAEECLNAAGEILVTRTGPMQWTLESVNGLACRFARDANGDIQCTHSISCPGGEPTSFPFEFRFTLNQQE